MKRSYSELLRYVFKRFTVRRAFRTGVPTLLYYLNPKPLPTSRKPALFTMNILPPMMTVWYHFARKALGDKVDITIFDCSGALDPREFPGARVQKFLNLYASVKCDEFLRTIARNRRIAWLCDDDVFLLSGETLAILEREFADPLTASVSFKDRGWWHFEIDGREEPASGSYCLALNRQIVWEREHLSLAPAEGNTHPSSVKGGVRRYDTFDKANEILLTKGYRCAVVSAEERTRCLAWFSGLSGAVMLLSYFRRPEQVTEYLLTPPKEKWGANVLPGVLAGLLAIQTIQELYTQLTGHPYPLPALPRRSQLEQIRHDHEPLMRADQSFAWVDEASAQLWANL